MKGEGIDALRRQIVRYQNNESREKGDSRRHSRGSLFVTDRQMPERALKSTEARLRRGRKYANSTYKTYALNAKQR